MLSQKMQDALNEQINRELFSTYLYLSMSSYAESIGLKGIANWMRVQSQEELFDAMKFYDFVNERGGRVVLQEIAKPEHEWASVEELFQGVRNHENFITKSINELVDLAIEERDHATNSFLKWFVDEQVEEEASADEVLNKIKLTGGQGNALFMIDMELSKRVFVPPVTQ